MNERAEHRERWADDIAAYALGALDEREAARLEAHLVECEACSAELTWLEPAVDAIPASVEQLTPPPALRERLMATAREEAEPGEDAAREAKRERRFRLPPIGSIGLRPALAGASALLLAAGVAGYELRNSTDDGGGAAAETYSATVEAPGVRVDATLEVDGDEGVLHVEGMPPPKPNQVYQAWVERPGTAGGEPDVVPSSVFVVAEGGTGDVVIPHGLDGADRLMITREPKGGSNAPSGPPMMTLDLS